MVSIETLYSIFKEHPIITTDSRDCPAGSIFFALKGDNFNGNKFAQTALDNGCAYAVVDEANAIANAKAIIVDNVLTTLQQLANYHRRQLGTKIIGITGTNGKTTTKELISAVLSEKYNVLYTQGNLNNHIGVPRTLLRLTKEHDIAVIEMGANHPGEIKTLVNIVEPNYGIITNVGKAHIQGFGSFEGVIKTKGELYDYLRTKKDSKVFINACNKYLMGISQGLDLVKYGSETEPDNLGFVTECNPYLNFNLPLESSAPSLEGRVGGEARGTVNSHLIGSYNIDNMLAAACIGRYFGVSSELIVHALSSYQPSNNRSQLTVTADNTLIVDTYNANPTSMQAALDNFIQILANSKAKANKGFAILGDMRELGEISAEEHQKIVDKLAQSDIEKIWLVGSEFAQTKANANAKANAFTYFSDVEAVKAAITADKPKGYYILIKASNGIKLFQLPELL